MRALSLLASLVFGLSFAGAPQNAEKEQERAVDWKAQNWRTEWKILGFFDDPELVNCSIAPKEKRSIYPVIVRRESGYWFYLKGDFGTLIDEKKYAVVVTLDQEDQVIFEAVSNVEAETIAVQYPLDEVFALELAQKKHAVAIVAVEEDNSLSETDYHVTRIEEWDHKWAELEACYYDASHRSSDPKPVIQKSDAISTDIAYQPIELGQETIIRKTLPLMTLLSSFPYLELDSATRVIFDPQSDSHYLGWSMGDDVLDAAYFRTKPEEPEKTLWRLFAATKHDCENRDADIAFSNKDNGVAIGYTGCLNETAEEKYKNVTGSYSSFYVRTYADHNAVYRFNSSNSKLNANLFAFAFMAIDF